MVVIPVIGFGAFIEPFLYIRMTVGKIKPAGPDMVTGGEIDNLPATGRDWVEAPHLRNKIAVVEAVVPLIEQNKGSSIEMMAITTRSSMRVNPLNQEFFLKDSNGDWTRRSGIDNEIVRAE